MPRDEKPLTIGDRYKKMKNERRRSIVNKNRASGNICFYCYNPVRCSCGDKSQDGGMI